MGFVHWRPWLRWILEHEKASFFPKTLKSPQDPPPPHPNTVLCRISPRGGVKAGYSSLTTVCILIGRHCLWNSTPRGAYSSSARRGWGSLPGRGSECLGGERACHSRALRLPHTKEQHCLFCQYAFFLGGGTELGLGQVYGELEFLWLPLTWMNGAQEEGGEKGEGKPRSLTTCCSWLLARGGWSWQPSAWIEQGSFCGGSISGLPVLGTTICKSNISLCFGKEASGQQESTPVRYPGRLRYFTPLTASIFTSQTWGFCTF